MLQLVNRTYKQDDEITKDDIEILKEHKTIFEKYGMLKLFKSLLKADYINGLPAMTYYNLRIEDILNQIVDPNEIEFVKSYPIDLISLKETPIQLNSLYIAPRYNLLHIGNICHFNVCINILSSL